MLAVVRSTCIMTKSNEYYKALIKGINKHADALKPKIARMGSSDSVRIKVEKAREKRTQVVDKDFSRPKTNVDISWQLWEESFDKAYQEYLVSMENLIGHPASKLHQDILSFGGLDLEAEFKIKASKNSAFRPHILVGIPVAIAAFFGVAAVSEMEFDNASFTGLEFGATDLKHPDLKHTDLRRVDLRRAELRNVELRRTNLSGVDLSGVDLSGIDLSGAKLVHSDLSGAKLIATDLSGVDLRNANLSGVDLSSADLSGVKLANADLSDAMLWDKKLGEAINLTPEQIKTAKNWQKATYSPEFRKKLNLPDRQIAKKQNP